MSSSGPSSSGPSTSGASEATRLLQETAFYEEDDFEYEVQESRDSGRDKEMPANLMYSEVGYRPDLDKVTRSYRKGDQPKYNEVAKRMPVIITIPRVDVDVSNSDGDVPLESFGAFVGTSDEKFVHFRVHPDTQWPSFEVIVKQSNGKEVWFRIFANSLLTEQNEQERRIEHFTSYQCPAVQQEQGAYFDMNHPSVKQGVEAGNLAAVQLLLWDEAVADQDWSKLKYRRPIWGGDLSEREIQEIHTNYRKASLDGTLAQFDRRDALIARLHDAQEVTFIRQLPPNLHADFNNLMDFMYLCLSQCVNHGNVWFLHERAEGKHILQRAKLDINAPHPRWLDQEYKVKRNEKGEAIEAVPVKWASYRHPGVFPDIESCAVANATALARSVETLAAEIEGALGTSNAEISAYFHPWDTDPARKFGIEVMCDIPEGNVGGVSLVPEARTRVKVAFREDNKEYKFSGTVIPNFRQVPGVTFSAVVEVTGDSESYPFQSVEPAHRIKRISLRLQQDSLSIGRQYVSYQELFKGLKRAEGEGGPDFPRIIANAPPQDPNIVCNPWTAEMTDEHRQMFMNELKSHSMNDEQLEFGELFTRDSVGACVLVAPPGTGKTHLTAALIRALHVSNMEHLETGVRHPILVCAPSNLAVDEIFNKVLQFGDPEDIGMKAIRFRGGRERIRKQSPDSMDIDNDEEQEAYLLNNEWWHGMEQMTLGGSKSNEMDFGDREYHVDFRKTVEALSKDKTGSNISRRAQEYLGKSKEVAKGNMTRDKRKELLDQLDDLEGILHQHYFRSVTVLFSTFSSASHETPVEYFEPRALFGEEAAMANNPDLLTGITPYWNSLLHSVFIGDPMQQRGRALALGRNEFSNLQAESFMARVLKENGRYIQFRQLKVQHRSHTSIYKPVSDTFYGGTVIDHPSTNDIQTCRETAVACFRSVFGPVYKGWYRFGIAANHSDTNDSKKFQQTHSKSNSGECAMVIRLVKKLLAQEPPQGGRRIELSDILITTPYKGLATEIWMACKHEGWLKVRVDETGEQLDLGPIRIRTATSSQGQEGNIQIIAFCINEKDNGLKGLRFLAEKHALNVLMSRGKYMQIAIGNFQSWMYSIKKGGNKQLEQKRQPLYEFARIIGSFFKDLQDPSTCTVIDSDQAYNALAHNKVPVDKNAFAESLKIAPKRGAEDGTTFQKGNYGKNAAPTGQPALKKQKGAKKPPAAPRNPAPGAAKATLTLTPDTQKLLDDLEADWNSKLTLEDPYLKQQRESIKANKDLDKATRNHILSKLNERWLHLKANQFIDADKQLTRPGEDPMDIDDKPQPKAEAAVEQFPALPTTKPEATKSTTEPENAGEQQQQQQQQQQQPQQQQKQQQPPRRSSRAPKAHGKKS